MKSIAVIGLLFASGVLCQYEEDLAYKSQMYPLDENLVAQWEDLSYRESRFNPRNLQTICAATQFLNITSNKCVECPSQCPTCNSPSGSCDKCPYLLPNVAYPVQNQNTYGTGASCTEHQKNCIFKDPFCTGDCASSQNANRCQQCMKGTALTQVRDPLISSGAGMFVFPCTKCPVQYCVNCMLTAASDTPTCVECDKNFALQSDNSTGTPIQKCIRNANYCPPFCQCDSIEAIQAQNCTRCTDALYILTKEAGLSDFARCVRSDLLQSANIDCGEKCTTCNTLTGVCLECERGFAPNWDTTNLASNVRYSCQPICGPGCLNCNEATRSCIQCDEAKNFTQYTIDTITKTLRCYDITNMCDEACVNCDTSGLRAVPYSTVGRCVQCQTGFFVNTLGKCEKCPNLCRTCAKDTGSCFDCTSIRYTLYSSKVPGKLPKSLCTDKVCQPACLTCNIEDGMNSAFARPICQKCSQGSFLTPEQDCRLCPLNCGSCDDSTGKCNKCKPGFSLFLSNGDPMCISDSTVGVCQVPNCRTCNAQSNTTCAICDPGYNLNPLDATCPCKITLAFKSQFFTLDWLAVKITWNGRVEADAAIDPKLPVTFCDILTPETLVALDQVGSSHSCYLNYDIQTKQTTFTIKLNPLWVIAFDPVTKQPTLKISFDQAKLDTPNCDAELDAAHFTDVVLAGGDSSNPTVIISRSSLEIPLCTRQIVLSAGLTQGLFSRPALFQWSLYYMSPAEPNEFKKNLLLNQLNQFPASSDAIIQASNIDNLIGKALTLRLDVTNFLGKTGNALVDFNFARSEGIMIQNVMEEYVINPQNDFQLTPRADLSACNYTADTVNKIKRLNVECSIYSRDPVTTRYIFMSDLIDCMIPSGLMSLGVTYRIQFVAYDPLGEYTRNQTKIAPIKLVKPPILAKIIGGDKVIDSTKDLTLAVRGDNLSRDLSYKWSCKDVNTGLQCVDLYGFFLFLQGTDSIFIKSNILTPGASYQINFAAADQMDVSRVATDFVTIQTLPKTFKLLQVSIISDANQYNNQLNVFEKQYFKAVVLNDQSNIIPDMSKYIFTWSVTDSMNREFTNFQANMSSLFVQTGYMQPNNVYQVCISVSQAATKERGATCSKYKSSGDSNLFSFTVNPVTGNAFTSDFTFTASNTQGMKQQYFFEFGYILYQLNALNEAVDASYIPFETMQPVMTKTLKLQQAQTGQGNKVKTYAKVTGENGERFIYFQDITVNLQAQNATFIGDTIGQVNFNNLNSIFTKVTQVALVANLIEPKYKATVIRTLVSGIANITNMTISSDSSGTESMEQKRFTLARSLSQVSNLIRGDPEIITNKEKDQLKTVIYTLIGLDGLDKNAGGPKRSLTPSQVLINQTMKESTILTSQVMIKDEGMVQKKNVVKFSKVTATELLKICDDIFTAESTSNKTNPELKRVAVSGIKRILSGATDAISNNFAFDSATVRARTQMFFAGRDTIGGRKLSVQDPLMTTTNTEILLPDNTNYCKGRNCQMNLLLSKNSPLTAKLSGARILSSTISLSFESTEPLSETSLHVETIDINNLEKPITLKFQLSLASLNSQAPRGPRCMYYDVKQNQLSDQGVITRFNPTTGLVECDTYHLTDFSVIEYDASGLNLTTMMPNLERKDVFTPLALTSTTPVVIMIILGITLSALVPLSLVLDSFGEESVKKEQFMDPSKREKSLTDVMFFNKYEERTKPEYAKAKVEDGQGDEENIDDQDEEDAQNDEDDDDAYNILQKKLKREERIAKMKEAMSNNQARGSYSLFYMLCLAIRFQHRAINLIFAFDQSLSRLSRTFIIIASMFLCLAIIGLYCQVPGALIQGILVSIVAQKVILVILNLLMVKRPKLRRIKAFDKDIELNRPDTSGKVKEDNEPKFKEVITFKLSPCDKMSFAIGYFIIFTIIGGSIFFSLMYSQKISASENGQWATMFVIMLIFDFGIFEFLAIIISTVILKKVGEHPTSLGRLRNYIIKFGPRAIRTAKVSFGEKPKKKGPASPAKAQEVEETKGKEKKRSSGPTDPRERARLRAKREREKAMAEAAKKKEKQAASLEIKDISEGMNVLE